MTYATFGGQSGLWLPPRMTGFGGSQQNAAGDVTVANDLEEVQFIGRLVWEDYGASKTVSSAGGSLGWLPGASVTFNAVSTLRVGIKQASSISTSAGPAPRATTGAAAFDVYKDLVAGTDTITSTTYQTAAFANGSLSISSGDQVAVCFHLSKSSGTSSVKVRGASVTSQVPSTTLVTASGATFTIQSVLPNVIIKDDTGKVGYIFGTWVYASALTVQTAIGNGNIMGNKFRLSAPMKADGVACYFNMLATADCELGIWTDTNPPVAVASVAFDANQQAVASTAREVALPFSSQATLAANTDYVVGAKQTTANSVALYGFTVDDTTHWKAHPLGANCFAVSNTGGGAFSAINSSKTRVEAFAQLSSFDDGAGGGPVGQQCM